MSEPDESDEQKKETEAESQYTIRVNGSVYELSNEFREAIQNRARGEFRENPMFSCWWKVEDGDPMLVIETEGIMVPWDDLDELEVDEEASPFEQFEKDEKDDGDDVDDVDAGNGMKTVPPSNADDGEEEEEEIGRTHFSLTPQRFEEVPQPDSEDEDQIPPRPVKMDDDPALVYWVPRHPDMEECWSAGEAIIPTHSWVEWNVQAKADELRLVSGEEMKDDSHDHFESLCKLHDCEEVGEYEEEKDVPRNEDKTPGSVERKGKDSFEDGRYGGGHWQV